MCADDEYRLREKTGDRTDPSVDDVVEVALTRATEPRPANHPDSHIDQYVQQAVERFGESAVIECVQSILMIELTHRTAGAEAFGETNYVWGIKIGVAAYTYLDDLHKTQTETE
jgi:hypothetical protein